MRNALPHVPPATDDIFSVQNDRRAVGADRLGVVTTTDRLAVNSDLTNRSDDRELEEELQALERRIDTEFKSTD
ncbi:jg6142 [Pararge aegeria aegeria]|uniref:Jg6142 protein n=3 Tax=Pararge aegeria TaxID=116150 RepID=A0A8S4QCP2_9NEOP|nr:jg6142 [Pararge aegeria aegeria]